MIMQPNFFYIYFSVGLYTKKPFLNILFLGSVGLACASFLYISAVYSIISDLYGSWNEPELFSRHVR